MEVVTITGNDFSATARYEGSAISALLKGNADYAALDAVETLLTRLHVEAQRLAISETVVDLRQLEFMNSSCFRNFIGWITDIQELSAERRYKIRFLSNPKLHWQRRSIQSLRAFAVDLISVTEAQ